MLRRLTGPELGILGGLGRMGFADVLLVIWGESGHFLALLCL